MKAYFAVAELALLDLWLAVPAAVALTLQPELTVALMAATSSLGVLVAVYCSGALRKRFASLWSLVIYALLAFNFLKGAGA